MTSCADHSPIVERTEVLRLFNNNLASYVKLLAESAPGGEWSERDGAVLFAGAHAYPGTHTNGVLRLTDEIPPDELLARADAFFGPRRRSYAVWIRDDWDADLEAALSARGFVLNPPEAGMGVVRRDVPYDEGEHPLGEGCVMRRVEDGRAAVDYLRITGHAFEMNVPADVLARIFFHPKALLDPRIDAFVAYRDGTPLGCCLGFTDGGYAGLYAGATLPAARGLGLARATFAASANAGFARGARTAGGTGSEMGERVWVAMGCVVIARWRRWYGRPLDV
jgi:hypothetical protein